MTHTAANSNPFRAVFQGVSDLNELKKAYHALARQHHPDCGGSDAEMKAINAAYETRFEELKQAHNAKAAQDTSGRTCATTEAPREFIEIISLLLRLDGLQVELCGSWLWISGNTRSHKDALKAAGCRWAPKKGMWNWHHAEDGSPHYRGSASMAQIRSKYGSEIFRAAHREELPA